MPVIHAAVENGFAASAAFDRIAETYDSAFTHSAVGSAQRTLVQESLHERFHVGQRILEMNCGTGEDALRLAETGVRVVACDISEGMIAIARKKLSSKDPAPLVEFAVCANEDLDALEVPGNFDGAFSNFGGLNCTADLAAVARKLAGLVRPGGEVLICLMGRMCIWEAVWYGTQGNWRKAFRRFRSGGIPATVGGAGFHVFYPSVRATRRAFSSEFRLENWRGVGVTTPPSWLDSQFRKKPRLLALLAAADRWVGRMWILRGCADHTLFRFVRNGS